MSRIFPVKVSNERNGEPEEIRAAWLVPAAGMDKEIAKLTELEARQAGK
jgi:hypothetical protein